MQNSTGVANSNVKTGLGKTVKISGKQAEQMRAMGIEVREPGQIFFKVDDTTDPAVVLKPGTMNKLEASKELRRQYEEEETEMNFAKVFEGRHYKEVLVAITRTLNRVLGSIHGVQNFFGPSPTEIEIPVAIRNGQPVTERAFSGDLLVSAFEDAQAKIRIKGASTVSLTISAKKKYGHYISRIFDEVETELLENSIYKGRAVVVTAGDQGVDFNLTEIRVNDSIYLNRAEELIVQDYIIDELSAGGKRVYLFTGGYGNAKTETAMRVGAAALETNMTFFYVKDAKLFPQMLEMTRLYGASIVFLEDVDEIAGSVARDAAMNMILNTLDGMETKGRHLRVILTTNHIDKINEAARRPGRIDVIREFNNPDNETKCKIFAHYFKGLPGADDLNLMELSEYIGDISGATIAEISKRSVIQSRKHAQITDDVVRGAYASMEYHIKLMAGKVEKRTNTVDDLLAIIFEEQVSRKTNAISAVVEGHSEVLGNHGQMLQQILQRVG